MANRAPQLLVALVVLASALAAVNASDKEDYPKGAVVATTTLYPVSGHKKSMGKATLIIMTNGNSTVTVNLTGALTEITMAHIHLYNKTAGNPIFQGLLPALVGTTPVLLNPPITYKGYFSWVTQFYVDDISMWKSLLYWKLLYVNVHTVAVPSGAAQGYFYCKYNCYSKIDH